MVKTTLYLPENLKDRIDRTAESRGTSTADFIRDALRRAVEDEPEPARAHWGQFASGDPTLARRLDEVLAEGFGADR
jgi:Arc/MetJ-type ribon-helix-helix transcriptional regulator